MFDHLRSSLRRRATVLRDLAAQSVLARRAGYAHPDADGRLQDGDVTLHATWAREPGGRVVGAKAPTVEQAVAATLSGLAVDVLRPRDGDVLVVRLPDDVPLFDDALVARLEVATRNLWRRRIVVVVLPFGARVHSEPRRKASEDLGYRETRNVGVDAGAADGEAGKHVCGAPR